MKSAILVETIEEANFSYEYMLKNKNEKLIILSFNPNIQSFFKKKKYKMLFNSQLFRQRVI